MVMKTETLRESIAEAQRFIFAAKVLLNAQFDKPDLYRNPRESGAAKRASLDLTRKLADLRAGR